MSERRTFNDSVALCNSMGAILIEPRNVETVSKVMSSLNIDSTNPGQLWANIKYDKDDNM